MSGILVFLQQENGKLNSASLSAISAAREISLKSSGAEIVGLCLGAESNIAAAHAAKLGLTTIYWSSQPAFQSYLGLAYAAAVSALAKEKNFSFIVAASTSSGKDFLPAVAAHLDAAMASEVLAITEQGNFIRPMYAGNVMAEVTLDSSIKVISIRASSFAVSEETGTECPVTEFGFNVDAAQYGSVLEFDSSATGRPELADAKIVVSGGRGVQSKEGFEKYINPLADSLGAAIGASRAAVDAGFAPNDWQVGQTGKTVAPQLYIAVGISGAIQHIAGMKDSKVVVAINKDAEAPIFEVADYGLVADLEKAVPELIGLIKS